MNNQDRNTRTLIVSFAIAIMALVPFRMVEVGQMGSLMEVNNPVVLGESTVAEPVMVKEVSLLEAPYREIEEKCANDVVLNERIKVLETKLNQSGWTEGQVGEMLKGIREMEMEKCK